MAPPKKTIPTSQVIVQVPLDVAAQVDLLLMHPGSFRIAKGQRSDLIVMLMRRWLAERKGGSNG